VDYGYTIAVDQDGNSYVGGFGNGSTSLFDIFVLKYNTNGDTVWTRRWTSSYPNYSAYCYSIAVDNDGNVYTTGFMSDGFTGGRFITLKYNSSGVLQWTADYKGPGTSIDYGNCIVVDDAGNSYVTGWSGSENNLHDYTTIKYSPDGDSLWVRRYNGSANDNDYAYWLALDASGDVYVTGQTVETGSDNDITTIKYSNDGDVLWVQKYNGTGNGYDAGQAIAVDADGNAYVTGNHTTISGLECATIKISSDGDLLWSSSYPAPGVMISIALDDSANSYVSGFANSNIVTVKYNAGGEQQWAEVYNGPAGSYDGSYAVTVDNNYNVIVTGYSTGIGTDYDYTTIKYSQPVVPVELTGFTASAQNGTVMLNWQTATESNNRGFNVERFGESLNNKWRKIGFVQGSGTTTEPRTYSFTDKNLTSGKYSYRLKQIDFDGSYEYSNVVEVEAAVPLEFSLSQNYPNPFNPSTMIKYSVPKDGYVSLTVYNALGQQAANLVNGIVKAGSHEVTFTAKNLSSGVYYYRIQAGENVSVKKMMVVK
jgi:hypothetical protein